MSLLVPETGLLFWMTLSFGVVAFILIRFAFPVITKAIDGRKRHIELSLRKAEQSRESAENLKSQAEEIIEKAEKEGNTIVLEAKHMAESMIEEARRKAETVARKRHETAELEAGELKRKAKEEAVGEIAGISLRIAGKIIGEAMDSPEEHQKLIERLLKTELDNENPEKS